METWPVGTWDAPRPVDQRARSDVECVVIRSSTMAIRTQPTVYPLHSNMRSRRSIVARKVGSCFARWSTTCVAWMTVE